MVRPPRAATRLSAADIQPGEGVGNNRQFLASEHDVGRSCVLVGLLRITGANQRMGQTGLSQRPGDRELCGGGGVGVGNGTKLFQEDQHLLTVLHPESRVL